MLAMPPAMSSQYLQVPKAIPRRKSRSRSRSRQREASPTPTEIEVPARSTGVVVSTPTRFRPQTPPMPAPELHVKPTGGGFADYYRKADESSRSRMNGYMNSTSSAPRSPTPAVEEQTGTSYDDLAEELYTFEAPSLPPPPPPEPLRQKLVGAWKLESYVAYPTTDSPVQRPTYPMTRNVTGFIMYTPDGYMSAQMLIPGQQSFKRGEGEEPQWAEAGKRFFAYSGPYYINDEGKGREETLRHTFQVCNLPGWIGDIQIRTHKFEDDGQVLVLGSEEPTEIKTKAEGTQSRLLTERQGDKRIPVLKWRRARNNTDGVPPPPTPQIKVSGPGEP
ncbi:hypothetical protein LTR97_012816 [Elasticomyces elasticus]|uniref:Lipocalin-like domain-containing protein n=1 Tax=Elasticomyces elasticus TaxID=574655 RepID=A0AAN7ZY91_9PEZI|nr:hypothetical protein LTR97_012816 [Elasticomyces elasticus]